MGQRSLTLQLHYKVPEQIKTHCMISDPDPKTNTNINPNSAQALNQPNLNPTAKPNPIYIYIYIYGVSNSNAKPNINSNSNTNPNFPKFEILTTSVSLRRSSFPPPRLRLDLMMHFTQNKY